MKGGRLEDYWWDLWAAVEWERVCLEGCSEEARERIRALGRSMVKDYLRFGTTVPEIVERLAAEKKELQRKLDRLGAQGAGSSGRLALVREVERLGALRQEAGNENVRLAGELEALNARVREREEFVGVLEHAMAQLHEVSGSRRDKLDMASTELLKAEQASSDTAMKRR